jgi:hypothetical protein
VQRSFYYWKTVFTLTSKEQRALTALSVQKLYVKFFDVDWDSQKRSALPVAKSIFSQTPPVNTTITPVVFITQEPLQNLDEKGLDSLGLHIGALLSSIATGNGLHLSNEIQLDCDWTQNTKAKYFYLINRLKQQPFFQKKIISATIRLHQLKFLSQAGIPPVDKGLLMCYNMGNLRHPQTKNSIIDEGELKKYINNLDSYTLPLDVALPIFDWWVLFDRDNYKGLVREFSPGERWGGKEKIQFERDTIINGFSFKAGQWVRHENSDAAVIKRCADRISDKLKQKELTVILYHLNQNNLANYSTHEMENFYNRFR